jgi:hypothetical protein
VPVGGADVVVLAVVSGGSDQRGLGWGCQGDAGAAGSGGGDGVQQAVGMEGDGERGAVQRAADRAGPVGLVAPARSQLDLTG